ncbi:MAG: aminotransferase class V-fold PLP-dependent enzyme, partial [Proteobacteria bacterium]|nr:aminotransferase class V-fold PLP-dependent enzyme [Pseudomonadota bacterium]
MALDLNTIKKDFPILERLVNGKRLVYLDNAATSQKPKQVIDAISNFYLNNNSNIHRGLHTLSEEASNLYDASRENISNFLGCSRVDEVIFTSGTTESTNLIAFGWGEKNLSEGDEIISFLSEHHSNFVPWQQLAKKKKLKFFVQNIKEDFTFDLDDFYSKINSNTKLIAMSHASNVLGNIFDIKTIIHNIKKINPQTKIFVDGAQAAP